MKLYELTNAYEQVSILAEEDSESFIDTLDSIQDAIEDKTENIVKWMKNIEAEEKAYKDESDRLSEKASKLKKKRESLKSYLEHCLKTAGIEKQKAGLWSLNFQNNPPSVDIADESIIPEKYLVSQPCKIDKKAILNDLKSGVEIVGVSLKQEKSLRIR